MILTTEQAAAELRVTCSTVRTLVQRGELAPVVPGARPLRFRLLDVADAQTRRWTAAERDTLDRLAASWVASSSSV